MVEGRAGLLAHGAAEAVRRIARRYLPAPHGDRYADYMLAQSGRIAFEVVPHRVSHWGLDGPDEVARLLKT
jgi:hypothetical protein